MLDVRLYEINRARLIEPRILVPRIKPSGSSAVLLLLYYDLLILVTAGWYMKLDRMRETEKAG